VDLDSIIQAKIHEEVASQFQSHLEGIAEMLQGKNPEDENHMTARFLSLSKGMVYTGYESLNGFKAFLNKNNIRIIPNGGGKNQRVDREEIDRAMMRDRVQEYKKQLKI